MITALLRRPPSHAGTRRTRCSEPQGCGRLAKAAIVATYRASVAFPGICRLRDISAPAISGVAIMSSWIVPPVVIPLAIAADIVVVAIYQALL